MKKLTFLGIIFLLSANLFALPFNSQLSESEKTKLENGEVVIKNIDYAKYISLDSSYDENTAAVVKAFNNLNPKYLAEIIQIRPYEGNENLPEQLNTILENISDYAGIPYWSERHQKYYDLYSSAEIKDILQDGNNSKIKAELYMEPFGTVCEDISVNQTENSLLYKAKNTNNLKYEGITCVSSGKLVTYIYLFRCDDKWVLYGIGGVNAPHIPFLTDRIRVSFINRIKTFCNFVFTKI